MAAFVWWGREGYLSLVRDLDVGEERGSEGTLGSFRSRADGRNGILC